MNEIKVTLHNSGRDVTTAYPRHMEADVVRLLANYIAQGKQFTVTYE